MAGILVYAEVADARPAAIALELLSKARELGQVDAVALGPGAREAAAQLGAYGARRVFLNDDPAFAEYLAEPATDCMAALIEREPPDLILFGFTSDGREVAGRLGARLDVGVISNALDISGASGSYEAQVPYFGGARVANYRANNRPAIVLVRPKSFEASESGGQAQMVEIEAAIAERSRRARISERHDEVSDQVKLEDARIVVAGGRGLGGPENFALVEGLASALGGAAGATRAIVDAGWVPYSFQIGQTGKTVRPGVYIAAGISGAMQHTVGMKGAKVIVAINKDAHAPILKLADLGVVGDVTKILPKLTEAVKAKRAS
ncbi:MAG: electron transfer flavoprotein subunit alpha/FixB family protein [Candidatus Dormibacteraeota bacterium]|uniref:Electron transfer flavoprotein subunit alpha/FixB family protein n=1 Tax=Candidatus Dormiibacter inghamiae TaxID=3127013 RepID=A0A934KID2_9BACT|nr:electron transfer flavoprotein subunit alpha/FixB family protein [Candidatus Dormibacteraeota bacterium]MBJ7605793.1 electron transfer flavoprotein subunit alpha/FixB family protein [Candidatus Dormibacteraeota bacterium]